ncbi:MAG: helix-turn-helix domain-containing protein [Deltaproteobacteria bacterium]|nr:helix-turn-helix domain-containing protein [Deltaproteobacteria bacterium]
MPSLAQENKATNFNPVSAPKNWMTAKVEPETVKQIKKALGLTVDQLAELLGVSTSSVFRYESTGSQALPQGALSKKIILLHCWLAQSQAHESIKKLILVKDGLAAMAGLLAAASVIVSSKNGDGALSLQSAQGAGEPPNNVNGCPPLELLVEKLSMAFGQTFWPLIKKGQPIEEPGGITAEGLEEEAKKIDAEAKVCEAEVRKLEAKAKLIEAQAKVKSARLLLNEAI